MIEPKKALTISITMMLIGALLLIVTGAIVGDTPSSETPLVATFIIIVGGLTFFASLLATVSLLVLSQLDN